MDEAQHYREQAAELCKIANNASDDIIRKRLLKNAASCEQMAVALDTIATAVCAHAKLTVGTPQHFKSSATLLAPNPHEPSRNC